MDIPIMYRVILEEMYKRSHEGELRREVAKNILRIRYRLQKYSISLILTELKDMGLLKFESKLQLVIKDIGVYIE